MRLCLFGLAAAALVVSATNFECAQSSIEDLAARTSCGGSKRITQCLSTDVDLQVIEGIEDCFVAAGCNKEDASVEAWKFMGHCNEPEPEEEYTEGGDDLRIRQISIDPNLDAATLTESNQDSTEEPTQTAVQTSAKKTQAPGTTTKGKTTAAPSSTDATTTSEPSITSTPDSSSASTPTPTTSTDSTVSADSETTTTAPPTTTGLVCSVTSTKSTTQCSVSKGKTVSCLSTVTAIASCAPGVICFPDKSGLPQPCMRRDDHLTLSGLIVAIAFGVGISGMVISLIVLHFRNRAQQRNNILAQQMLAASRADAETSQVFSSGKRYASEANLPLIQPGGARSDQQRYDQEFYTQEGPRYDQGNLGPGSAPQLHQGLGSLNQGQNLRY